MIREPWFWRDKGLAAQVIAAALTPIAFCYDYASKLRRRLATPLRVPATVVCIGNLTLGGVGKTPFSLMLAEILMQAGHKVHFLSRGHGGQLTGPLRVDPEKHSAIEVGDEPLLLARKAPTWIARNKRTGAKAAAAHADIIIMDDGFQNPAVKKDVSILLASHEHLSGDLKVFPAGPLRERFEEARIRADRVIEIVKQSQNAPSNSAFDHCAWLEPRPINSDRPVFAFCGIGNPARFFDMLAMTGLELAGRAAFPDHYPYSAKDIDALRLRAKKHGAALVTTEKDWVRIDSKQRADISFLPVSMQVTAPEKLRAFIEAAMAGRR